MKQCAWISRHPPLKAQRESLAAYRIHQINPPGRLWSAADAVVLAQNVCGGWPDLFVVVLPVIMLKQLVELVDGRAPVLRSVVKPWEDQPWSGHWHQVTSVQINTREWFPKGQG